MTERDLLMRAILDDPDDDTARLAFADWLDETGRPRDAAHAELIRLQVARHRRIVDALATDSEFDSGALDRDRAILRKWGRGWLPKAARRPNQEFRADAIEIRIGDRYPAVFTFGRGFVEAVRVVVGDPAHLKPAAAVPVLRQFFAHSPVYMVRLAVDGIEPEVDLHLSREDEGWGVHLGWIYASVNTGGFTERRAAIGCLLAYLEDRLPGIVQEMLAMPAPPIPF
jgi:uncharacterized protein (TIGR02996 family)